MSLLASPPQYATVREAFASIKRGEQSWRVYALQAVLNSIRFDEKLPWVRLALDGDFTEQVETVVLSYQQRAGLVVDGIVGPATQGALIAWAGKRVDAVLPALPDGLMRGFAVGEGMNLLAATNWSVPGGVDCGPAQLRVYGPPYPIQSADKVGLNLAFNPVRALMQAGNSYLATLEGFQHAAAVRSHPRPLEFAMRCAIMAHNWPTAGGADHIARYGKCSNPSGKCTWVQRDANGASKVFFPDGVRVETRWEWCQFYAMGSAHGEGLISKHVTEWA